MKAVRILIAAAASLLVASCLFTPGKFDARMAVMKDGSFTYQYKGEILLVTTHALAAAIGDGERGEERFDPDQQYCYGEKPAAGGGAPSPPRAEPPRVQPPRTVPPRTGVQMPVILSVPVPAEPRSCTAAEIEAKRAEWERRQVERRARKERESAATKALFGGIDPSDPATMTEFARRLQGQGGWKTIVHKGEGLFEVDYAISGRLDHDFVFPVFEGMDLIVPFVQATQRGVGRVRVTAPAFVKPGSGADRFGMSTLGAAAMMREGSPPWPFRPPEGTFTLTTDGTILTNNTREGPAAKGASQMLRWTVTPLDTVKPEALIQL